MLAKHLAPLAALLSLGAASAQDSLDRPWEQDVIYFLLPDRFENGDPSNDQGGIEGGRLEHGFDPSAKGFYHGGDLAGLRQRLDYLEELGVTAIWLGPIYENKPVQGPPGQESAAYHGYWITDFTNVDPHLGTREELKALIDDAHGRGIKVILDIITNHTADVIAYRECSDPDYDGPNKVESCAYRREAAYPYTTRYGPEGEAINAGFAGIDEGTEENFAKLTNPNWAYTPFLFPGDETAKTPAWLNDPIHYHNRGNFDDPGESFLGGDFFGLDDLMTEHPKVIDGMIEIFGDWIEDFGIDGFRIDTARHVQPSFWQAFIPAIEERAKAAGKDDFLIFGEVFDPDPAALARHTREDGFPAVLDFAFQSAVQDVVAAGGGTRRLARLFEADVLYDGGLETAGRLPTFLGNHDMGRFSQFIREANPDADEEEMLRRLGLAHILLLTSRGVPTLYAGSEQGFVSDGGDQLAREDMFSSKTAVYNDNDLLATDATTAESNFDTDSRLFGFVQSLVALRRSEPALQAGRQLTRYEEVGGGLFAFSRIAQDGTEILVAINAGEEARTAYVEVEPGSTRWTTLFGSCAGEAVAQGSFRIELPPLGGVACKSQG